jgi:hypothetical protein
MFVYECQGYLQSIQLQHSHQISVGQIGFPTKVVKQGARQDNDQWKEHGIVQWHFVAWLGNKGNDQGNDQRKRVDQIVNGSLD